ncbi:MAG TPA: SH3 domain-containing protein [Lacipirellulaceae bacterium]|jgi:uncharacterized protein YgiM (DUF1202 family)|nr:SH3 domain-containing protein [Lacipirellulaceae bacterium]
MQRLRVTFHGAERTTIAAFILAFSLTARAIEVAPYEARVIVSGAAVRSGPGDNFYPTDSLGKGDVVEVYREKAGGWVGIRPTTSSYSLVSGRDIQVREGGVADVINDNAPSRIGSRLSDKHNAVQVHLKKGEMIEVIGEQLLGNETWYKISPPAGEFRWVQESLLERIGPIKQASAESVAPASSTSADSNGVNAMTDAVAPPLIATKPAAAAAPAPVAKPSPPAAAADVTPPSPATRVASSPTRTNLGAANAADEDLQHELAAIEVRLSRMASAPVNLWNTERLERDAMQLMNKAQTPADRDAVQSTINRINQFASIGRRSTNPTTAVAQVGASPITPVPGAASQTPSASPYDAVGVLRPVVSRRPGAPQFALVDEHGQVLTFVTPTPDVNLQAYIGHRVGVVGNRGFIAEFNRTHVTAARVTPLNDSILR